MNGRQKRLGLLVDTLLILFVLFIGCATNVEAKVAKNENDVKALKIIIKEQRVKGATVSTDLSSHTQYVWNSKTGRLKKIMWEDKGVQGKLVLSQFAGLEYVDVNSNDISVLKINRLAKLKFLACSDNKLKKLKVAKLKKLEVLNCNKNKIKKLELSNNKKLKELTARIIKLKNLH